MTTTYKNLQKKGKIRRNLMSLLNEEDEDLIIEHTKVSNLQKKYEKFKKRYSAR
ncbi:MAG: hypothetical protein K2X86_03415 [Cytophagaceae bacterium]|nr:hypothetical protein [Cytophagaceae bacterium]